MRVSVGNKVYFRWGWDYYEGRVTRIRQIGDNKFVFQVFRWNPFNFFFHKWLDFDRYVKKPIELQHLDICMEPPPAQPATDVLSAEVPK